MAKTPLAPERDQHVLADELLLLHEGILQKHADKQRFITLDEQIGKSKNHKNAVTVARQYVSFMVGRDALPVFSSQAQRLSLPTKYHEERRALRFSNLELEQVRAHRDFFLRLLIEAKRESQRRQGYFHLAFDGSDIMDMAIDGVEVYRSAT